MNTVSYPLNHIEFREWMNDRGSESTTNCALISSYKGPIDHFILHKSLEKLSQIHFLMRMTIKVVEGIPHFQELTPFPIPLIKYHYNSEKQWNEVAKNQLRQKFNKENEPLWRVAFIEGKGFGHIIMTFHHSIADGICGIEAMNHLFMIMSSLLLDEDPAIAFDETFPPLQALYSRIKSQTERKSFEKKEPLPAHPCHLHTNFAKHVIDRPITEQVIQWCRKHDLKVHSVLFASLLKAIKQVKRTSFDQYEAISIVNFRKLFDPPVSPALMRPLFSWISGKFEVHENTELLSLSKSIQDDLYSKIQKGEHVDALKNFPNFLEKHPLPKDFLAQSKMPPNVFAVTNMGEVTFNGYYPYKDLVMTELFGVANCDPFLKYEHNCNLGVVTFQQRMFLVLFFLEELFPEELAHATLRQIENLLILNSN